MTEFHEADSDPSSRGPNGRGSRELCVGEDGLSRLFAACCESAFEVELGVVDPPLVDYMADLLMRFCRLDAVEQERDAEGRRLRRVTALLHEAENRHGPARGRIHRHIGDVSLFWTGVYPESLPKLLDMDGPDFLLDLPAAGRRCYLLAADEQAESADVLERIAVEYEVCQDGLHRARQCWETMAAGDPDLN